MDGKSIYARPVKKRCSDFKMKLDLKISSEFKIARSLILSCVVSKQALIDIIQNRVFKFIVTCFLYQRSG